MRLEPLLLAICLLLLPEVAASPADAPPLALECAERRARLAADWAEEIAAGSLEPGMLILAGAPASERTRFLQADNFFYLTGIASPGVTAILTPSTPSGQQTEILFLPPPSQQSVLWHGPELAFHEDAAATTAFRQVRKKSEFRQVAADLIQASRIIYFLDEPGEEPGISRQRVLRQISGIQGSDAWDLLPLEQLVHRRRRIKSEFEIERITEAVVATAQGLAAGAAAAAPGAFEYQVQAAIEGRFVAAGAEGPGFPSIVGSGPNSCILHYTQNRRRMEAGEVLLLDVGARVGQYTADVTRTIPVSGRFTKRQRDLYVIVLEAQQAAAEAARPGMTLDELHQVAARVISSGLVRLGLLPGEAGESLSKQAYRRYLPHGTSHWLGLAVHDVGRGPLEPGTVFTIEPGIYLPGERIGVRIEDDYVMTDSGRAVRLSVGIPRGVDEVEQWVQTLRADRGH
ncbi:MAG: Xaa-Pro aminopeptidase [Planctomycetota bacterium]